jgi:hypothetical protein
MSNAEARRNDKRGMTKHERARDPSRASSLVIDSSFVIPKFVISSMFQTLSVPAANRDDKLHARRSRKSARL